jgi:hypothetical protein
MNADPKPAAAVAFLGLILASGTFLASSVLAQGGTGKQEEPVSPDAAAQIQSRASDGEKANRGDQPGTPSGTSNDRLFKLLPNFLTLEDAGKLPPLTTRQKFKVVARGSFDLVVFPWYGLLAGISQAENSESGYGQGAAGYGKRFGAYYADGVIENFMVGAVLPSLLRQDPRFYQSSHGKFLHRLGYAVSRIRAPTGRCRTPSACGDPRWDTTRSR